MSHNLHDTPHTETNQWIRKVGEKKKRPGEHQLGKQNLPLHLTLITVTV